MAVKASAVITLSSVTDIESVWWYYKLQSSTLNPPAKPTTNPPPSGWADSEPAYTPGSTNTLYFVELTIFSDGTFDYGNVSVSSSYEAAKAAWNKAQEANDRVTLAETAIEQTQQAISLRATKQEVEESLEAVSGSVDAVSQTVEELGEMVISPDELVSRVTTSTAFQQLQTEVSQNAQGVTFITSIVSGENGLGERVESLESVVHIGADGIGIYRSDYPYQMQMGAWGWVIRNGDVETIAARESKMFAPRVQVNDALIMGRTAWKVGSDARLRWIRY